MKPRVSLSEQAFMDILNKCESKIIKAQKTWLQGHMYVIESDGYYYYTHSKEPLSIPENREVVCSKFVHF
ncbi:hypothetical protein MNBD_PLANCTO02-1893 [hydrothermal vent metagenome]|uniref:Uncharacterized protein n=1 Tax=hydrothermal vent metagenome TaxID=652676 RepID=A0A3B1DN53_9ZZZZ